MNTKKSKNKRAKPVHVEEKDVLSENKEGIEIVEIVECVPKQDSKLQEPTTIENNHPADNVPKKPKRTKGKKKKETLVEDNKNVDLEKSKHQELDEKCVDEEFIENVPIVRKKKSKSKNNTQSGEEVNMSTPVELLPAAELPKEVISEPSVTLSPVNLESTVKEIVTQKKKKKKKHRHDSDKTDMNEQQNCTLAFQRLLQSSDQCDQEVTDSEKINDAPDEVFDKTIESIPITTILIEKSEEQYSKDLIKDESTKTKKKNKKGKKQPPTEGPDENKEIKVSHASEVQQEIIDLQGDIAIKEASPKPKAKIAKPVEKKRKVKTDLQEANNGVLAKASDTVNIGDKVENLHVEVKEIIQTNIGTSTKTDNVFNKQDISPAHITKIQIQEGMDTSENNVCETSETTATTKIESQSTLDEMKSDDNDFVTVTGKSGKSKRKKHRDVEDFAFTESEKPVDISRATEKPVDILPTTEKLVDVLPSTEKLVDVLPTTDKPVDILPTIDKPVDILPTTEKSLDISPIMESTTLPETLNTSIIELEEVETSNIVVPDFIDYPRSLSQLVVDNNNNTIIQEITTPEEVKLGIPLYTPTPIIQGSGESPEVPTNKTNTDIKVTEIDLSLPSENKSIEKTDIKSKMIEVNRDMEELRRSIERSLAGLTNTDKSDSNIEKEFEELFQTQCQESNASENTDINPKDEIESLSEPRNVSTDNVDETKNCSQLYPLQAKDVVEAFREDRVVPEVSRKVPVCPARRDKGKGKSKKKGKQDHCSASTSTQTIPMTVAETAAKAKDTKSDRNAKKDEKPNEKSDSSEGKCKKQAAEVSDSNKGTQENENHLSLNVNFEPIENFEDALTSSFDDVAKTFELIASDTSDAGPLLYQNNPEINIIAPAEETEGEDKRKQEEKKKQKQTPVSQPKNLLGHTDIPVSSNKADYKREKNKEPNYIKAKVKIKDSVEIEKKINDINKPESKKGELFDDIHDFGLSPARANEDLVYKYTFRKVYLQSLCHVCKREIAHRVPCQFCFLVFYCNQRHKDEDWPRHQPLCFAVCTIAHLKNQKHIYADAKNITGQAYRVLRMQMILSCEKILKRKLVSWEQEVMLYPRICADVSCREWKQGKLTDCAGCGQISHCTEHPKHLPTTHQRWCKSYALYQKLVMYHHNFGKLETKLPTKVLERYQIPDNINEVLGSLYEENIDISDIQYAALTQTATAPLTTAYCYQLFARNRHSSSTNGMTKNRTEQSSTFTIHSIGSELNSEADSLKKWEIFFLHLLSDVKELRVVFIDPDISTTKLPLELLGKIKLCEDCRANERRVLFNFEDKKNYQDYYSSDDFVVPNIVCAFNPNIQRSSIYNRDVWPTTIRCIQRQKIPFIITSCSLEDLKQDLVHIKKISTAFGVISEPRNNPFASVRPDRNFITDHEMPLMFKNYCYSVLCGA